MVARVCTDAKTAYIIDNVLTMLYRVSRMPSGLLADYAFVVCLV